MLHLTYHTVVCTYLIVEVNSQNSLEKMEKVVTRNILDYIVALDF